jgi:hypothetical protein
MESQVLATLRALSTEVAAFANPLFQENKKEEIEGNMCGSESRMGAKE